jgi:hypothetical protein
MEIVRRAVEQKGASSGVAKRIANNVRDSSLLVYDGKWKAFVKWCEEEGINPLTPSEANVSDFLLKLFEVNKLQISTIKGYRTSIVRVVKHTCNVSLKDNDLINDLMKNLTRERPRNITVYPKWDLGIVLTELTKKPYEPINETNIKPLTKKTLFLLLLASGARRGEVHAIDPLRTLELHGGKTMWLRPKIDFVAKNHNLATGKGAFLGFQITELLVPGSNKRHKLCPVRAVRRYLHVTKDERGRRRDLFLCCDGTANAAAKNTLSAWVKTTIAEAYTACNSAAGSCLHRSAHEIRAVASSLAVYKNVAIEEVLSQCRWSAGNTFAKHYLRDVSGSRDGVEQLLPLVVAGKILQ